MEHTQPDTVFYSVEEVKQLGLNLDNATARIAPQNTDPIHPGDMVLITRHEPKPEPGETEIKKLPVSLGTLATIPQGCDLSSKGKRFNMFIKYPYPDRKFFIRGDMSYWKVSGFDIPLADLPLADLPPID